MRFQGAEAKVKINENDVEKNRISKSYRHPDLDKNIRETRNRREAKAIRKASRAGANVPQILEEKDFALTMERIEGELLKNDLKSKHCSKIGKNLAKLHESDIIHGDLTTSNAIVSDEESIYLIDFGLSFRSERIEDRAMDLHMFRQILRSSHPNKEERCWRSFLEGYSSYSKSDKVISQLDEVEMRGRYKT